MSSSLYSIYEPEITSASSANSLPDGLLASVLGAESGYDPSAYNSASGATGIAQFLPSTAANPGYGISPFDPADPSSSISSAGQYLYALYQQSGSWLSAVESYGTLPSGTTSTSGLNAAQTAVYNAATTADNNSEANGSFGPDGSYVPPSNIINPANPSQTMAGGSVGSMAAVEAWLSAGVWRIGIFVLAIIFLGLGLAALALHDGNIKKAAASLVP